MYKNIYSIKTSKHFLKIMKILNKYIALNEGLDYYNYMILYTNSHRAKYSLCPKAYMAERVWWLDL